MAKISIPAKNVEEKAYACIISIKISVGSAALLFL
jgi:hypothetical protein